MVVYVRCTIAVAKLGAEQTMIVSQYHCQVYGQTVTLVSRAELPVERTAGATCWTCEFPSGLCDYPSDVRACPRPPLSFLSSVLRSDAHLAWGVQLAFQAGDDPIRLAVVQPQDTVSVALEA